jgi:uncharacterized protein
VKCTLAITQKCNLACDYCYIQKNEVTMRLATAQNIVNHVFLNSPLDEKIDFGFFGGEPLLEFALIKCITGIIQSHERYSPERVTLTVTTNGTILTRQIIDFLIANSFALCISCDGPPIVQNRHRHFKNGKGSSTLVEKNIKRALEIFPLIPVNAVYSPETMESLPDVVAYLVSLGVERIFLNPDISAVWTEKEATILPRLFDSIGKMYLDYHLRSKPKYISLIDSKIAVILKGGYQPMEKCRMGDGELAFAPSGNIYPCERLIGSDNENSHCLGNINDKIELKKRCRHIPTEAVNTECAHCSLNGYCMNWCGCTNYAMAGSYDTAAAFLCASEKAAINVAFDTIRLAGDNNINLSHTLTGAPFSSTACIT